MEQIIREKPVKIKSHAENNVIEVKAAIISIIAKTGLSLAQFLQPTTEQVNTAAEGIIKHFGALSLDDLILCMEMGLMGHFGPLMRYDVNIILEWCKKYEEAKRVKATQMPEKKEVKDNGPAVKMPAEVKQLLQKLKTKTLAPLNFTAQDFTNEDEDEFLHGPKKKKYKRGEPIKASEVEIEAFNAYDAILYDQEKKSGTSLTFITWGGVHYNQGTWVHYFFYTLYRNDALYDELTQYLETIKRK